MVYGRYRRYNRRGRRSTRRRYSRLSSTRVLTNKSATSQARQIIALNRKINSVYRATRPETKVFISSSREFTLTNSIVSGTYVSDILTGPDTLGTQDYQRIGNIIYVKNLNVMFNCEYNITANNNVEEPSFHKGEASHSSVRIIVVQTKYPLITSNDPPPLAKILEYNASSGIDYNLRTVSPLANNFSETFKLLYDRVITLDVNNPEVSIKIRIPNFTIRYDRNTSLGNQAAYFPIIYFVSNGLHADADFSDQIHGSWAYKLAYTDA